MLEYDLVKKIANEYGTPLYVFDIEELRKRVSTIKEILGDKMQLCYAMKANPFLISYIDDLVDKFEVCSPGEYNICKERKIKTEKVVLSGVYKAEKDIRQMVSNGFNGIYTIESVEQMRVLLEKHIEYDQKAKLILRLSSGNQFGLGQKELLDIISDKKVNERFVIIGIQYFSGTQKKKMQTIQKELEYVVGFCDEIKRLTNIQIEQIEFGPGLYMDYFEKYESDTKDVEELAYMLDLVKEKYRFTIELGRYIAAACGTYITKVVDVKTNNNTNYCIVDGGIHHISYYGQLPGIKNPLIRFLAKERNNKEEGQWTVCGSLCTIHDILLKNYVMNQPCIGDYLCFEKCGAYSVTETGMFFLSRDMPIILALNANDKVEKLRDIISTYKFNMNEVKRNG